MRNICNFFNSSVTALYPLAAILVVALARYGEFQKHENDRLILSIKYTHKGLVDRQRMSITWTICAPAKSVQRDFAVGIIGTKWNSSLSVDECVSVWALFTRRKWCAVKVWTIFEYCIHFVQSSDNDSDTHILRASSNKNRQCFRNTVLGCRFLRWRRPRLQFWAI